MKTFPSMLFTNSWGVPRAISWPALSIRMFRAMNSMSETMWVVQITTLSRATVAITFRSRTRSLGSSPAVGSSRSSSLGSFSRAWAMPSRWRMPPENSPILRLLSSRRFTVSKSRSTVASSSRWLSFIPLTAAMYRRNSSARKDL